MLSGDEEIDRSVVFVFSFDAFNLDFEHVPFVFIVD